MLSIGKFSKESGLSISTLRRWDKDGSLKPYFVSGKGTCYYSIEQLHSLQNKSISTSTNSAKKTIGYCRVSSNKQKNDFVRQIDNVKSYMIAKGYQFEVISDIGSEKTEEQELAEDLVQIITIFGARLNGKRANKAKQLIKEINPYFGEIL